MYFCTFTFTACIWTSLTYKLQHHETWLWKIRLEAVRFYTYSPNWVAHSNVTAISVLGGLAVVILTQIVRDRGSISQWGTEFFQIVDHHLFDPLLHLVANVISELKHIRTYFLFQGVNVIAISVLSGLAVMTLTWVSRDRGSIPSWGTELFLIANRHLFDPLLH